MPAGQLPPTLDRSHQPPLWESFGVSGGAGGPAGADTELGECPGRSRAEQRGSREHEELVLLLILVVSKDAQAVCTVFHSSHTLEVGSLTHQPPSSCYFPPPRPR